MSNSLQFKEKWKKRRAVIVELYIFICVRQNDIDLISWDVDFGSNKSTIRINYTHYSHIAFLLDLPLALDVR